MENNSVTINIPKIESVSQGMETDYVDDTYFNINHPVDNLKKNNPIYDEQNNKYFSGIDLTHDKLKKNDKITLRVKESLRTITTTNAINYDPSTNIIIKSWDDERPQNNNYFIKTKYYGKERKGLAVAIPCFNEPNEELQQTLLSLYDSWNFLRAGSMKWTDEPMHVCIIQDGWNKADPSMKEYFKLLFPKKYKKNGEYVPWWEYFDDFNGTNKTPTNRTYIFQKRCHGPVCINPNKAFDNSQKFMRLTLIIKTNNRRKHNSHEWFFGKNGFADFVNPKYLFLTDAFTFFNITCIYHLVKSLDKNKKMVAVTGRQRVMSRLQQGSSESFFSLETMLRMVQMFDFESSNTIYNGAFSIGGLLPVIPGPCSMYRASNLLDDNVRNYYFETVNKDPDSTGITLGNLKIAEDRVLTYASVVKSAIKGAYMELNPLALFNFEAETNLKNFLFQRRRWINGSVAGYFYLLFFNFTHFAQWNTNIFRKIYVWILLMCQFMTYMLIGIAPAIQIKIFYYGLTYFLNYYNVHLNFDIVIIGVICWAIYIIHVFIHHRTNYNQAIIYILLIFSFSSTIISFASILHYIFIDQQMTLIQAINAGGIILYVALYVMFGPFIVSLLLSGKGHSFMFMIKSYVWYLLFLPMLIAWFCSYSYSRAWDLSWGNRPANEIDTLADDKKKRIISEFKRINIKIIIFLIAANISVYLVPLYGQLVLMSIFFFIASYQLTLSILYCLSKIFYKLIFVFKKCRINHKKNKIADSTNIV